jgi:hypothetical protein
MFKLILFTALANKGFADPREKKADIHFFNIDTGDKTAVF